MGIFLGVNLLVALVALEPVAVAGLHTVSLGVDWPAFLGQHDLLWNFSWKALPSNLAPQARHLHQCGGPGGACCLTVTSNNSVALAACSSAVTPWMPLPNGSIQVLVDGKLLCLSQAPSSHVAVTPCTDSAAQQWVQRAGNIMIGTSPHEARYQCSGNEACKPPSAVCLALDTPPFCDGTVCPFPMQSNFTSGLGVRLNDCQNGAVNRLFTFSQNGTMNLIPHSWIDSAYAGNGVLGVRIAAKEGAPGTFMLNTDNNNLGRQSHRIPTGWFEMTITSESGIADFNVEMVQKMYTGTVTGQVYEANTGSSVVEFTVFVNAANVTSSAMYVVFEAISGYHVQISWKTQTIKPTTVHSFQRDGVNCSEFTDGRLKFAAAHDLRAAGNKSVLIHTISTSSNPVDDAISTITSAFAQGYSAALTAHEGWWASYYPSSFVSVGDSRLEGSFTRVNFLLFLTRPLLMSTQECIGLR